MEFSLKLVLNRKYASESSVALVSTILFHRFFGCLEPEYKQTNGVTYPQPNTFEADALLNDKLKEYTTILNDEKTNSFKTVIQFYNAKQRRHSNWFTSESKGKVWEKWEILVLLDDNDSMEFVENELRRNMMKIIKLVDENKDHIPPVTRTEVMPFPYTVSVKQNPL